MPDGKYGSKLSNGTWNGMIRELQLKVRAVEMIEQKEMFLEIVNSQSIVRSFLQ